MENNENVKSVTEELNWLAIRNFGVGIYLLNGYFHCELRFGAGRSLAVTRAGRTLEEAVHAATVWAEQETVQKRHL